MPKLKSHPASSWGKVGLWRNRGSSFPQVESSESESDDLEQKLIALYQEMVESGQVDGGQVEPDLGEPLPSCDAQSGPVVDPKPKVNPCQTQAKAHSEPVKASKPKPKPKPKLKTKVKPTSPPAPVPSRQPKLTKRQQAQAKEQVEVITPGIQRCVVQLGWSAEQVVAFIKQRFGGRRRSELSHDDLVLLLYLMQTELLKP